MQILLAVTSPAHGRCSVASFSLTVVKAQVNACGLLLHSSFKLAVLANWLCHF